MNVKIKEIIVKFLIDEFEKSNELAPALFLLKDERLIGFDVENDCPTEIFIKPKGLAYFSEKNTRAKNKRKEKLFALLGKVLYLLIGGVVTWLFTKYAK